MSYIANTQVLKKTIETAQNNLEESYKKSLENIQNRTADYYNCQIESTNQTIYPWHNRYWSSDWLICVDPEFKPTNPEIKKNWYGKEFVFKVDNPNYLENRKQWIVDNLDKLKENCKSNLTYDFKNKLLKLSKLKFKLDITEEPLYITEEELQFLFDLVNQKPLAE